MRRTRENHRISLENRTKTQKKSKGKDPTPALREQPESVNQQSKRRNSREKGED